ncbi:RagB/SusD family nutrient uptake outer membrane protein [Mangrovibacterium diazotrophicum]|uniref:Putative outer membrane starch-binding protein n=1 Tax=Mangrovibacterium diazotrophicum TaxID=1261403 RepID=A0A419W622_9BACT|nr:RagB/SusD family nutrient uptake outer membrane protein [Mangrovibacterium diazotrophicum]RKD90913.1 putative outer membrane starch-binding protein [Mangrovibacterium diazotrophicum]
MKLKIFITFFIAAAFMFTGCEDNFDPKIYGSLSTTNFPQSEDDCQGLLMSCYQPFHIYWAYNLSGTSQRNWYVPTGGTLKIFDATSDLMAPWTIKVWSGWTDLSEANYANCHLWSRAPSDANPNSLEKIRDVTRFTAIIGTLEDVDFLSDETRQQFVAEGRLLRGIMMYNLFHMYGPVPVLLDPDLVGTEEGEQNLVRPTLDEMTSYISEDFEYAMEYMSNSQPNGRYTADYARYCAMVHYLNEGYHVDGYYEKAIQMYTELKASGYDLYTDGGDDAYADQFMQGHKFNQEVIMAVSVSSSGNGSAANGSFNPIAYYLVPDDAATADAEGNATPFMKNGWRQAFNISTDFYDTFEDDDLRKNTILTSYLKKDYTTVTRDNIGDKWNGFVVNKYPQEIDQSYQPTDWPLARWADVLLMYAEAVARKNQSVPTGDALQGVNDVRARAGLDALSGDAVASYDGFMDALLMERGHELFFEGKRKIDLIRFNKYRHNCTLYKGETPTHQYIPLPDYAIDEAESYGKTLTQTFEREGWSQDN